MLTPTLTKTGPKTATQPPPTIYDLLLEILALCETIFAAVQTNITLSQQVLAAIEALAEAQAAADKQMMASQARVEASLVRIETFLGIPQQVSDFTLSQIIIDGIRSKP
jgi:hypothetical protein